MKQLRRLDTCSSLPAVLSYNKSIFLCSKVLTMTLLPAGLHPTYIHIVRSWNSLFCLALGQRRLQNASYTGAFHCWKWSDGSEWFLTLSKMQNSSDEDIFDKHSLSLGCLVTLCSTRSCTVFEQLERDPVWCWIFSLHATAPHAGL